MVMFAPEMKRMGCHSLYVGGLLPAEPLEAKVTISSRRRFGGCLTRVASRAILGSAYCGESQLLGVDSLTTAAKAGREKAWRDDVLVHSLTRLEPQPDSLTTAVVLRDGLPQVQCFRHCHLLFLKTTTISRMMFARGVVHLDVASQDATPSGRQWNRY